MFNHTSGRAQRPLLLCMLRFRVAATYHGEMPSKLPAATITRRAAERLNHGHVWVYQSDIETLDADIPPGSLVRIVDRGNKLYGTATYSSSSQISLRLIAREQEITRPQFLFLIADRIQTAIARRASLFHEGNNAARLVFSEADDLPGLIVDRYADLVIVQLLSQGMAAEDVREVVTHALVQSLADSMQPLSAIVERPDSRIRELEELPPVSTEPLYLASNIERGVQNRPHGTPHTQEAADPAHATAAPLATVFTINKLKFEYDANAGQKTGAFLDQRENYAAAARYAATAGGNGRALDVCTYQGGFALHLARACTHVTGVDASRAALEVAERNLQLNRAALGPSEVDWIEADAFEILRDYAAAGTEYSTIVLDPPAFAKSKRAAESALRGYKELNLRAMQMLSPGGILVTCSCSHHVPLADFTATVASAAADAGRRVTLLEVRSAAPDHPVVLTLPETHYLKCLILRVD
jgi:23S rRNA (cytosine1962-C5)-methyltransferase